MRLRKIALVVGIAFAVSAISFVPAKAQLTDTTHVTNPVTKPVPLFNGKEASLSDSLQSLANDFQSPDIKTVLQNAVAKIESVPAKGSSLWVYLSYAVGVLGVAFGLYKFVTDKISLKNIATDIEAHLKLIASGFAPIPTDPPIVNEPAPDPEPEPAKASEVTSTALASSGKKNQALKITPMADGSFTIEQQ